VKKKKGTHPEKGYRAIDPESVLIEGTSLRGHVTAEMSKGEKRDLSEKKGTGRKLDRSHSQGRT